MREFAKPTNGNQMTEINSSSKKIGAFALETDSVEVAYATIIERLAIRYCLHQPDKSVKDFHEEILKPIADSTLDTPAKFNFTYATDHSKPTLALYMTQLLEACAYCVEAHTADEEKKQDLAWRHVSNAMYCLGILETTIIIEPAIEHIITVRNKAGGTKRNAKYKPIREYAIELAGKKKYHSARQAALDIQDDVVTFAKAHGVELAEYQRERTISGWLKNMTFASTRRP